MKKTRNRWTESFCAATVAILWLAGPAVLAQSADSLGLNGQARAGLETQGMVAATEADRAVLVGSLLDRWRFTTGDGGMELEALLAAAPVERIAAAARAETWNDFRAAVLGASTNVFGDTTGDLVFNPVAPCRIFDTRSAVAGILVAGVVRTFGVNGNMTAQGGDAGGCGIPVDPLAIVVNLAAVTPTGAGNIRAWRYSDPVPTAAALNYNPTNTSPALSNMITVPVCYGCGTGLDISLRSDVSNVHAVGDIVGYFLIPNGLPSLRRSVSAFTAFSTTTETPMTSITFTPTRTGTALAVGTGYCNLFQGGNNVIVAIDDTTQPFGEMALMRNPGAGAVVMQIPFAVQDTISITDGVSATVSLRLRRETGTGTDNCIGNLTVRENW